MVEARTLQQKYKPRFELGDENSVLSTVQKYTKCNTESFASGSQVEELCNKHNLQLCRYHNYL